MMRHILHLWHLRLVDHLGVVILFHFHFLITADHGLDFELLREFYLQSLVAGFGDVQLAPEVVDTVRVDVRRVDDFYCLLREVEVLLIALGHYHFMIAFTQLLGGRIVGYHLVYFFEAYFC